MKICVYISGCHSGPNPSPGRGIALSLRAAFPDVQLVGKDHSTQSSGLHDPVFDRVWLCRPWDELDLDCHREQIAERLHNDELYISGLDVETGWLSSAGLRGVLVPPAESIACTAKPGIIAFASLPGVAVPDWCSLDGEPADIHRFARMHDWRVWVKGPAYDAVLATGVRALEEARRKVGATWGDIGLHAQSDVQGREVSIAFAAHQGALLDAVYMEKRLLTDQGKTWTGRVSSVNSGLLEALRDRVAALRWTGGGELEFVLDEDGALWLVDFNSRFPAWIYGATLAGRNLPAQLVAAATGAAMVPSTVHGAEFTRVVTEIPVRADLPQPNPRARAPGTADTSLGKNPSGMPQLLRRLRRQGRGAVLSAQPDLPAWLKDLRAASDRTTPFRWLLIRDAAERFEHCRRMAAEVSGSVDVRIAYSIKTNPTKVLIALARQNGFLAEVISSQEHALAIDAGFRMEDIVLNGPAAGYLVEQRLPCGVAFADSVEALQILVHRSDGVCGPRIRPPGVASRFGVDVEDPREFAACFAVLDRMSSGALGVSMHVQSSVVGLGRWSRAVESTVEFASALGRLGSRPVTCLDLGGGWSADDLDEVFTKQLPMLVRAAHRSLPGLRTMVLEPGKLLADPTCVTVATVLEMRRRGDGTREAVADASVADLPMSRALPHQILATRDELAEPIGLGEDRILGRLCLETDILRSDVRLPEWLTPGDRLIFRDTGGYDASMSFAFGTGQLNV